MRPQFLTSLRLVHPSGDLRQDFVLPATELVEHTPGEPDCQVLIRRDVLSYLEFGYDDPADRFAVTYCPLAASPTVNS